MKETKKWGYGTNEVSKLERKKQRKKTKTTKLIQKVLSLNWKEESTEYFYCGNTLSILEN